MDTVFDRALIRGYSSKSQIARVLTESWIAANMYCPVCGCTLLAKFPNNRAVADFYCPDCRNEFELKSKNGQIGRKIADGTYHTFIERITGNDNPDFLIMSYSLERMQVENMYFIPKFFFVPEIVEKREPLSANAHRAGWVGCNILFTKIPVQGRIAVVQDGSFVDKQLVMNQVQQAQNMRMDTLSARGWLMDILNCVNSIEGNIFTLEKVYAFADDLAVKHPGNNNIQAKIRQQLQELRKRNIIAFLGNGHYRKNV